VRSGRWERGEFGAGGGGCVEEGWTGAASKREASAAAEAKAADAENEGAVLGERRGKNKGE